MFWGLIRGNLALVLFLFSGCIGLTKSDTAVEEELEVTARFARTFNGAANLTRMSPDVLAIRLKMIFPMMNTDMVVFGVNAPNVTAQGRAKILSGLDRSTGSLAQIALKAAVVAPCGTENRLFNTEDILMSGETLPADGSVRLALAAARNAWLYPYKEDSAEVQALASLYAKVVAESNATEARKAVCMTALSAPQFWVGNPGPQDFVRRVALELARRPPRFSEYSDLATGRLSRRTFLTNLQREPGYLSAVKTWHRNWLGLERRATGGYAGIKGVIPYQMSSMGWQGSGGSLMSVVKKNLRMPDGSMREVPTIAIATIDWGGWYTDPEQCSDIVQDFNPVTTEYRWEVKKVGAPDWTELAYETKAANGTWSSVKKRVNLRDITLPHMGPNGKYVFQEAMPTLNFPSPMYDDPTTADIRAFDAGGLRVRRFSGPGQEQNGYSPVKQYLSGETVYACNTITRYLATCAQRPRPGPNSSSYSSDYAAGYSFSIGGQYNANYDVAGMGNVPWRAGAPMLGFAVGGYPAVGKISVTAGRVIDEMSCGIPNLDELRKGGVPNSGFNEASAIPKTPPYNEVAYGVVGSDFVDPRPGVYAGDLANPDFPIMRQITEDIDNEPYALLEDIVGNVGGEKSYKLLLTADYTFGHAPLEMLYRTNLLPLPTYLTKGPRPGDADYNSTALRKIVSRDFESFPVGWLRNTRGWYGYDQAPVAATIREKKLKEVLPRPMSGVLTQMAFLQPMAPKVRSLVSRIFTRLLCSDPSGITTTASDKVLHRKYLYPNPKHLDETKGCYACHINMDPLGTAIAGLYFLKNSDLEDGNYGNLASRGEMQNNSGFLGIQGLSNPEVIGEGAVMGQKVRGVREVAQVLADSPQFASCVVLTAFENVFGRKPTFTEATLVKESTASFMKHYNFNELVRELALSENFAMEP